MRRQLERWADRGRRLLDATAWSVSNRFVHAVRYRPAPVGPWATPGRDLEPGPDGAIDAAPRGGLEVASRGGLDSGTLDAEVAASEAPAEVARWAGQAQAAQLLSAAVFSAIDQAGALIVRRKIEPGRRPGVLVPHPHAVAVLVVDMRGFSRLTERLDDTQYVAEIVDEYLTEMTDAVERDRGVVFQYTGDGLLALFLPELARSEPDVLLERLCTKTSAEMHARFEKLRARWAADWQRDGRTGSDVGLGIGVSYGPATIGLLGPSGKKYFGIVGGPVNLAAYLCSQARPGTVLADARSFERAGGAPPSSKKVRLSSEKLHQRVEALAIRHAPS